MATVSFDGKTVKRRFLIAECSCWLQQWLQARGAVTDNMTNNGHAHNIRFIQECHTAAQAAGTETEKFKETKVCPKIS